MSTDYDLDAEEADLDVGVEWDLEIYDGQTWDRAEFETQFDLVGYAEPFVVVKRKLDGQRGTLEYVATGEGWPTTYFGFTPA
jgi:hypothetical protein